PPDAAPAQGSGRALHEAPAARSFRCEGVLQLGAGESAGIRADSPAVDVAVLVAGGVAPGVGTGIGAGEGGVAVGERAVVTAVESGGVAGVDAAAGAGTQCQAVGPDGATRLGVGFHPDLGGGLDAGAVRAVEASVRAELHAPAQTDGPGHVPERIGAPIGPGAPGALGGDVQMPEVPVDLAPLEEVPAQGGEVPAGGVGPCGLAGAGVPLPAIELLRTGSAPARPVPQAAAQGIQQIPGERPAQQRAGDTAGAEDVPGDVPQGREETATLIAGGLLLLLGVPVELLTGGAHLLGPGEHARLHGAVPQSPERLGVGTLPEDRVDARAHRSGDVRDALRPSLAGRAMHAHLLRVATVEPGHDAPFP